MFPPHQLGAQTTIGASPSSRSFLQQPVHDGCDVSEATLWDWSLRAVCEPEPGLFRLCLTYQSTVSHLAGCGGRLVESWSDHFLPAARWLKFR